MYIDFLNKNRQNILEALPKGAANRIATQLSKPNNTINNILKGRDMMITPSDELIEKIVKMAIIEIKNEAEKSDLRNALIHYFDESMVM